MAIKRVKFKKQAFGLWVASTRSLSDDVYICDEGLRQWFEFPKDVTEFDIVLVTLDTFWDKFAAWHVTPDTEGWYTFEVAHLNSRGQDKRLILLVREDYEYESVPVSYGVRNFLEKLAGEGYYALRLEY
jgi:hypothetical protein